MAHDKLDIAVLAKLSCGMDQSSMTTNTQRGQQLERQVQRTDFYLRFLYLPGPFQADTHDQSEQAQCTDRALQGGWLRSTGSPQQAQEASKCSEV